MVRGTQRTEGKWVLAWLWLRTNGEVATPYRAVCPLQMASISQMKKRKVKILLRLGVSCLVTQRQRISPGSRPARATQ